MKNVTQLLLLLFAIVLVISCRDSADIPEDIHEHDEIEKLVLTAVNKNNPQDRQTINYIGGIADKKLTLLAGQTYDVSLDFLVKHNDHYDSVNEEIAQEKDEHFITYEFAGTDITILRRDNDVVRTDGQRLGLRTEWQVNSITNNANTVIKLVHLPAVAQQNFPTATNQQGKTTGGETDVNAVIGIN